METLQKQTDLWKSMLQSSTADTKEMLKVLTSIVTETVQMYSNQRYSFVLFTLLDHTNNALAHFQHLEHICPNSQNVAGTDGGDVNNDNGDIAMTNTSSNVETPDVQPTNVAQMSKETEIPSEVILQDAVQQLEPNLENTVIQCQLVDNGVHVTVNESRDNSFIGELVLQHEKEPSNETISLEPVRQNAIVQPEVGCMQVPMTSKNTPDHSLLAGIEEVKLKRTTSMKVKKTINQKQAGKQSDPPRSVQAGCCILCCEVVSANSVKEHYLSSHMQHGNGNFILKCPICEQVYQKSCDASDITPSDIFSLIESLEEHMALVHPMQSIFKCASCSYVTFSTQELAVHSQTHQDNTEISASSPRLNIGNSQNAYQTAAATEGSLNPALVSLKKETSTGEDQRLIKECIFCVDKTKAPRDLKVVDFGKHLLREHVTREEEKLKLKCPHCPHALWEGEKTNIRQLLYWTLNHINTHHKATSPTGASPQVSVLHCKQCQLISTNKDDVCEHMKALNSSKHDKAAKNVVAEEYSEIEEEEGLSGQRPALQCFLCPEGDSTITTLDECKMHFRSQHVCLGPSAAISCNICDANFTCPLADLAQNLTYLIKMIALHFSKEHGQPISQFFQRLKCPHCSYYSILKKNIWKHQQEKHWNSMVCDKCGKVLKAQSLASSHHNFCKGNMNKKKFQCTSCDQLFCSSGARNRHDKIVHKKSQEYGCPHCSKRFSKRHNLQLHVLRCHKINDTEKETEKCPVCGFVTFAGYQMENHMKSHEAGTYECKHCKAVFPTKRKLYHHIKMKHASRRMLQCDECEFKTRDKANLTQHVNCVHRGMSLTCTICKHRAMDETKLKAHMESKHSSSSESGNNKSFPCKMCEKVFSTKHRLETHAFNIHNLNMTNKEVHECSSCNYRAIEKSMLKLHMQNAHATLAIFNCQICGRAFKSQAKLQNHKRRSHPVKNKYQCDACSYVTDSKSQFVLHHSRKHTGSRMKCLLCKYATYQKHLFNRHMEQKHSKQEMEESVLAKRESTSLTSVLTHQVAPDPAIPSKAINSFLTMSWQPERPNEVTVSSARNVHLVSQNPELLGRTGSLCMRQTDLQSNATAPSVFPTISALVNSTSNNHQVTAPPDGASIQLQQSMPSKPTAPIASTSRTLMPQHEPDWFAVSNE